MLDPFSITVRVVFSLIWMGLWLLAYACAFGEWWVFYAAIALPVVILCTRTVWSLFVMILQTIRVLFSEPQGPVASEAIREAFTKAGIDYSRVKLKLHNWWSRYTAMSFALATMLLQIPASGVDEMIIAGIGGTLTILVLIFPKIDAIFDGKGGEETR